jgi:hypothetical protein
VWRYTSVKYRWRFSGHVETGVTLFHTLLSCHGNRRPITVQTINAQVYEANGTICCNCNKPPNMKQQTTASSGFTPTCSKTQLISTTAKSGPIKFRVSSFRLIIRHDLFYYLCQTLPRAGIAQSKWWLGDWLNGLGSIPGSNRRFSLRYFVQTGTSSPTEWASREGRKAASASIWPLTSPGAEVTNVWSYTSTPPVSLHGVVLS